MIITDFKHILVCSFLALAVLPVSGQDLLANQAPIDRKMKTVDSVMLQRLIQFETLESPASDLYDEWDTEHTHYRSTPMPDEATIDLRDFCMPTKSRVITSNFGYRWGRQHKGLDIKVYIGDTIRAAFSGKVRIVKYEPRGYGKYVVIRHPNGLETYYGHLSKQLVLENDEVHAGDPIGLGGNTGRSTGSHLHFETRLCGVALNPALMFDFSNQDVVDDYYVFHRNTYQKESAQATRLRGAGGVSYTPENIRGEGGETVDFAASPVTSRNYSNGVRFHKVKRGETLSAIARKRGTTIDAICKLNHIGRNIRLMPGQILKYN